MEKGTKGVELLCAIIDHATVTHWHLCSRIFSIFSIVKKTVKIIKFRYSVKATKI
jgi:hypothetical protein